MVALPSADPSISLSILSDSSSDVNMALEMSEDNNADEYFWSSLQDLFFPKIRSDKNKCLNGWRRYFYYETTNPSTHLLSRITNQAIIVGSMNNKCWNSNIMMSSWWERFWRVRVIRSLLSGKVSIVNTMIGVAKIHCLICCGRILFD